MRSPSSNRRRVRYAGGPPRAVERELLVVVALALIGASLWWAAQRVSHASLEAAQDGEGVVAEGQQAAAEWPENVLVAVFLDVGQGDGMFFRTPLGKTYLVDGGPGAGEYSNFDAGTSVVLPFLRSMGIRRLDGIVMSHPHEDHLGGLIAVLEEIDVGEIIDPGFVYESERYEQFLQMIRDKGVDFRIVRAGDELDWGSDVFVKVLGPPHEYYTGTRSDPNNNSVVLKVQYGDIRFLLPGDAEVDAEMTLSRYATGLQAEILKAPHHGSKYSSIDLFLNQVEPETVIISAGKNNSFGHPGTATLQRYRSRGTQIYRTDLNGSITVLSDGRTYQVLAQRG